MDKKKLTDGWYVEAPVCCEEQRQYTEKIKIARKPVNQELRNEWTYEAAKKIAKLLLDELCGEASCSAKMAMLPIVIQKTKTLLDKHDLDIMPTKARYWLPHDGETVYIVAERNDGSKFVKEVEYNLFDCSLTNILALGQMIFLSPGEAVAAIATMEGRRNTPGDMGHKGDPGVCPICGRADSLHRFTTEAGRKWSCSVCGWEDSNG